MRTLMLIGLVIAGTSCMAGYSNTPRTPWLGCYDLERGPWDSRPEAGLRDQPGPHLRLTINRAPRVRSYRGPHLPIDRPVFLAELGEAQGSWWSITSDSAVVVTGGSAGVALYLGGNPDELLTGSAETFTGEARAFLRARPVDC